MIKCSESLLNQLLQHASENNCYQKAVELAVMEYQLKPYNIITLNPLQILELYRIIKTKYYDAEIQSQFEVWHENELRIFVWMLVVHAFLQDKGILDMDEQDWRFFGLIFYRKNPAVFQFESLCLVKMKKAVKWNIQQKNLLIEMMNQKKEKNKWNQIAKKMFIVSNKLYFRTPKQCREQWFNHLDPSKTRAKWTTVEDYQLLKAIMYFGKRWSKVAKYLGNIRTQHMVKNRFKSLIRNQQQVANSQKDQNLLMVRIRQRLETLNITRKYNKKLQNSKQYQIFQQSNQLISNNNKTNSKKHPKNKDKLQIIQQRLTMNSIFIKQQNGPVDQSYEIKVSIAEDENNNNNFTPHSPNWLWEEYPEINEIKIKDFSNKKQDSPIYDEENQMNIFYCGQEI